VSIRVSGATEVVNNLGKLDDEMKRAVERIFQYFAQVAENEMKTGARWTDQTGVARSGLVAQADNDGESFTLNMASMASYGIWLEIRWSGKYAIVGPVMEQISTRIARMIADTALP
jgi:hypothetical protein